MDDDVFLLLHFQNALNNHEFLAAYSTPWEHTSEYKKLWCTQFDDQALIGGGGENSEKSLVHHDRMR